MLSYNKWKLSVMSISTVFHEMAARLQKKISMARSTTRTCNTSTVPTSSSTTPATVPSAMDTTSDTTPSLATEPTSTTVSIKDLVRQMERAHILYNYSIVASVNESGQAGVTTMNAWVQAEFDLCVRYHTQQEVFGLIGWDFFKPINMAQ